MRIVVTGAGGRLGQALVRLLPEGETIALTHRDWDIRDEHGLRGIVAFEPSVVVNCAAYNGVDAAETDAERAVDVNAVGPTQLAFACRQIGAWLVHLSTDAVFDGRSSRPYREEDLAVPMNAYGRSKRTGEIGVEASRARYAIIRTCGLYGRGGSWPNFVDRILAKARAGEPLRVVCDQVCTPTYAKDLAETIAALLPRLLDGSAAPGIYHATNSGECSWCHFACSALNLAGIDYPVEQISAAEWNAPAPRPRYTVLANTKLPPLRHWREALADYLGSEP